MMFLSRASKVYAGTKLLIHTCTPTNVISCLRKLQQVELKKRSILKVTSNTDTNTEVDM